MWNIYTMGYYSAVNKRHKENWRQMDGTRKNHPDWDNSEAEK